MSRNVSRTVGNVEGSRNNLNLLEVRSLPILLFETQTPAKTKRIRNLCPLFPISTTKISNRVKLIGYLHC